MALYIVQCDITTMAVDAIVNAANSTLLGGGGVDGCIHRAAGPEMLAQCRPLGGCETGSAKLTGAGKLPCRYVIHAVGPVWHGGDQGEPELLRSCYRTALELTREKGCKTVAFPLISAGIYGYPKDQAILLAAQTIHQCMGDMTVYLVLFDKQAYALSRTMDLSAYVDGFDVDIPRETRPENSR